MDITGSSVSMEHIAVRVYQVSADEWVNQMWYIQHNRILLDNKNMDDP